MGTRRTLRARAPFAVIVAAFVAVSCTGRDEPATSETTAATTSVAPAAPATDDTLTIGVMLPSSATLLRDSIAIGAETAIEQINQAGGVLGRDVRLVRVDEGDTIATGSDALQTLLSRNADAIVGPTSSVIALGILDRIVSADVVTCSPTASALALDLFPDNGRFFRTIASDSMQARAIGQKAQETGVQSVAVVHVDDAYGRPFAAAVESVLLSESIEVSDTVGFASGDVDLDDEVQRVIGSGSRVVIVLTNADDGARFLEAVGQSRSSQFSTIIVNDAMRAPEAAQRLALLRAGVRDNVLGVAPQAESPDAESPFDPPGPFATNTFDCVTLLALAASQADSEAPTDIADQVASVSAGGQVCRTFAVCNEAIRSGLQIDYNGPSGITEIGTARGDPTWARFEVFGFDSTGSTLVSSFEVES